MPHSHSHTHDHHSHGHSHHSVPHGPEAYNLSFAIAVILNLVYTLAQVFYALYANSMGLLADAGHNFGDVLGLIFAWGASWLLTLPARKRYSYGYKRTTILAAIANAIILVSASVAIAYASIDKLFHLKPVNTDVVIIIALIGIFVNGGTSLLFMKGADSDLNIKGAFYHLLADALVSFGVVVAAIIIHFTGYLWIDPITGLLIVAVILWGTWGLLRDSIGLILDAVPHYIDHTGINEYFAHLPGVTAVHDLHIWGLSTREVALTVHLVMPEKPLSDQDYQQINSTLLNQFKIHHATIQVESGSIEHPCEVVKKC